MALVKSRRFANDFKPDCSAETVPPHRDLPFRTLSCNLGDHCHMGKRKRSSADPIRTKNTLSIPAAFTSCVASCGNAGAGATTASSIPPRGRAPDRPVPPAPPVPVACVTGNAATPVWAHRDPRPMGADPSGVALPAEKTSAELAQLCDGHPNLIAARDVRCLTAGPGLFSGRGSVGSGFEKCRTPRSARRCWSSF